MPGVDRKFLGRVAGVGDVHVHLRHVHVLQIPARKDLGHASAPRERAQAVIHPLAGESGEHGTVSLMLAFPQHARQIAERVLVADLDQIRLLVAEDLPDRPAIRQQEAVREDEPVAAIDNR
jgi:hypothetical protein